LETRMNKDYAKKIERPSALLLWKLPESMRRTGCMGCNEPCKGRYAGLHGNDSICAENVFSAMFNKKGGIDDPEAERMGADLAQRYGLNAVALLKGLEYLRELNKIGVLGKGKEVDCDFPFDKITDVEFAEEYVEAIAYRKGIGNDLAEGFPRAAEKWGRIKKDLKIGILKFPHWGYGEHYDPRSEVYWGYSTILSGRDCNEHSFSGLFLYPSHALNTGLELPYSAEELVEIYASNLYPYEGDTRLLDFSIGNIYSEHMVKLVSWHRYYDSFWKNSALYCDIKWPFAFDPAGVQLFTVGLVKFWNAVTGKGWDFLEGMNIGKKIWNLDNAVWTLQGRHRDMVHFADYIYETPFQGFRVGNIVMDYYGPVKESGKWRYLNFKGRQLDKEKFEEFKTKFYGFQGWDPATGWPTRSGLESLGLGYVADELEKHGRIGEGD